MTVTDGVVALVPAAHSVQAVAHTHAEANHAIHHEQKEPRNKGRGAGLIPAHEAAFTVVEYLPEAQAT